MRKGVNEKGVNIHTYIFILCQSDIENIVNPFGHSID
jgi:hypothetical protein